MEVVCDLRVSLDGVSAVGKDWLVVAIQNPSVNQAMWAPPQDFAMFG